MVPVWRHATVGMRRTSRSSLRAIAGLRCLRRCCGPVLLDDVRRYPAAVLDVDALFLGPFADLGGVNCLSTAAATADLSAGGPAYLAGVLVLP